MIIKKHSLFIALTTLIFSATATESTKYDVVLRMNPEFTWHSYLCRNANIKPVIEIQSLDPQITERRFLDMAKNLVVAGKLSKNTFKRHRNYTLAYRHIKKEFFKAGRDITSLTQEDIKVVHNIIMKGSAEPAILRSTPVFVLRHPFLKIADILKPALVEEFGEFSPEEKKFLGTEEAHAYIEAVNQREKELITQGKVSTITNSDRPLSPTMMSIINKILDTSAPTAREDIVAGLQKAIGLIQSSPMHPIALAAQVFDIICLTHPFDDGNGRTALLIANLILVKGGYLPILCGGIEYNKAFAEVLKAYKSGHENHEPMIDYFIEQLYIITLFQDTSIARPLSPEALAEFIATSKMPSIYATMIHPTEETIRAMIRQHIATRK